MSLVLVNGTMTFKKNLFYLEFLHYDLINYKLFITLQTPCSSLMNPSLGNPQLSSETEVAHFW